MDPTVGKNDVSVSLSILNRVCQGLNSLMLGMFIPPLVGILTNDWYINPYYWIDEFIPCYMEIMEVLTLAQVVNTISPWNAPQKNVAEAGVQAKL